MNLIICQSTDNDANNDYNLYLLAPDDLDYAFLLVDAETARIKRLHPDDWDCAMIVEAVAKYGIVPPNGQSYCKEEV